jgi:diguanylate cyclase (GGDEF)-like protein/PAS domain S-box-containing protein
MKTWLAHSWRRRYRRNAWVLIPAFGALLVAAMWAALLNRIAVERGYTMDAGVHDTEGFVAAFEQHARRILREADRTLLLLQSQARQPGARDLRAIAASPFVMTDRNLVALVDADGALIAANRDVDAPVENALRDLSAVHATGPDRLVVGRPVQRRDGSTALLVSRMLAMPDGRPGAVAIVLPPSEFTDFYLESDLGKAGALAVFGLDGHLRARRAGGGVASSQPDVANQELLERASERPFGHYERASPYDGVPRLVAYRKLADYPIIVAAAQGTYETLGQFRRHRATYIVVAAIASALIVAFFLSMTMLTRRLERRTSQLRAQRRFLQALLDNIPLGISVRRFGGPGSGKYLVWNETNAILFGLKANAVLGKALEDIAPAETAAKITQWDRELEASPGVQEVVEARTEADGTRRLVHRLRTPLFGADDRVEFVVTVSKDITRERASEDELRLASKVFETTADGIVISDENDRIIMVNSAFTRLSGFTWQEMVGKSLADAPFAPLDPDEYARRLARLESDGTVTAEVRRRNKEGYELELWLTATVVRGDDGAIRNYVRVFTDISVLKDAQRRLEHLANFDALTGLPNRRLFDDRLEHALRRNRRSGRGVGVLFLDLDGFKHVNDSKGHDAGDQLLKDVAGRISACLRASDSLCRLGGDEFTIVIEDAILPDHAIFIAERILETLSHPFRIGDDLLTIATSIGIAIHPRDGVTSADLVLRADGAMYAAKNAGGNRYAFFEEIPEDEEPVAGG